MLTIEVVRIIPPHSAVGRPRTRLEAARKWHEGRLTGALRDEIRLRHCQRATQRYGVSPFMVKKY